VNREPLARAERNYAAATKEFQENQKIPVVTPQGTFYLPPQSAERFFATQAQQKGAGERTAAQVAGREQVAKETNQNKAEIAAAQQFGANWRAELAKQAKEDVASMQQGKSGKPVPGTVGGNLTWGQFIPNKGWVNPETQEPIPNFEPPPNYAEVAPQLRAVTVMGPGAVPTVENMARFNAQGGQAESGGGQYGASAAQGGAIQRSATNLKAEIEDRRDKIGNVGAIIKSAFLGTPLADPEQAFIATRLASFAALNPRLHGFRGQQALDEFIKIIGGIPKNVDALLRSIDAISETAGEVSYNPFTGGAGGAGGQTGAPPQGAKVIKYDKQGNRTK